MSRNIRELMWLPTVSRPESLQTRYEVSPMPSTINDISHRTWAKAMPNINTEYFHQVCSRIITMYSFPATNLNWSLVTHSSRQCVFIYFLRKQIYLRCSKMYRQVKGRVFNTVIIKGLFLTFVEVVCGSICLVYFVVQVWQYTYHTIWYSIQLFCIQRVENST